MSNFIPEDINEYCENNSSKDSDLLVELIAYTYDNEMIPQMISGAQVANVLLGFIKALDARRIIEVGMFTGYSALKMAEILPEDGEIHTLELMDKHIKTAESFFNRSPHNNKIKIHRGPALKSLEKFAKSTFDFAFIDANKSDYLDYYLQCKSLIRKNGVIVLDNMLWSGKVLSPDDSDTVALKKTAEFIQNDDQVFNYLMPIRDGLMICLKK